MKFSWMSVAIVLKTGLIEDALMCYENEDSKNSSLSCSHRKHSPENNYRNSNSSKEYKINSSSS